MSFSPVKAPSRSPQSTPSQLPQRTPTRSPSPPAFATQSPRGARRFTPPPVPQFNDVYPTWQLAKEDVEKELQAYGFAIRKRGSNNPDKDGVYRRHNFVCVKAGRCGNKGLGIRERGSKRSGCGFSLHIKRLDANSDSWEVVYTNSTHNHPPAATRKAYPQWRSIDAATETLIHQMASGPKLSSRQILITLQKRDVIDGTSKYANLTQKDVKNVICRLRTRSREGLSATQTFLKELSDRKMYHEYAVDDEQRLKYAYFTFDQCRKMYKTHPQLIGMDSTFNVRTPAPSSTVPRG